ncbi:MAG TPA: amidohydrolase family protein [Burkholderiales bacterium]|jgi:aminocarboxymuconate-semialdehyde decarboxylase|nr:amidohydrolase family protein [Burkholderiales bacterium]
MSKQPVIDVHAHYYPAPYLALLKHHGFPADTVYSTADPRKPDDPGSRTHKLRDRAFTELDLRLAAMDRQGVDVHALSLPPPYAFARNGELLVKIARTFNDAASAAHCAHPDRLVGLATLPVHDPAEAIKELERAAQLPGIRGVGLGTRFAERDLSDPAFFPLYERIAALKLPIFLHYAPLTVIGMGDRLTRFHLANLIGNTTETAIAAAHLIFGGVLDAFPTLEVCLPHSGGVFPILIGRFDRGFHVRAECNHLPHAPSHYLRRFTYDTVCHSEAVMEFLIRLVGVDRIALGSDYCFDMGYENPVEALQAITGLDASNRAKVLGGNAARLLGL